MPRPNKYDKYILTLFPGRDETGEFDEDFDYCNWRIPDPDTYGEFFTCFIGQHEIGSSNYYHNYYFYFY